MIEIEMEVIRAKKQQTKALDKNKIPTLVTTYEFTLEGKLDSDTKLRGNIYTNKYLFNTGEKIKIIKEGEIDEDNK